MIAADLPGWYRRLELAHYMDNRTEHCRSDTFRSCVDSHFNSLSIGIQGLPLIYNQKYTKKRCDKSPN